MLVTPPRWADASVLREGMPFALPEEEPEVPKYVAPVPPISFGSFDPEDLAWGDPEPKASTKRGSNKIIMPKAKVATQLRPPPVKAKQE